MSELKMQPFKFSRGNRSRGMTNFVLTQEEYDKVAPVLNRLNTASDAIRFLYDQGWTNAAICKVIQYPSDTQYHKMGDPLLPQHVATTISKYRTEKESDPVRYPAIRNVMVPPRLIVDLTRSEVVEVDVNPERQTPEEIGASAPAEADLDKEMKEEEAPAENVRTAEVEATQPPTDVNVTGTQWEGELRKSMANNYKDVPAKD